MFADTGSQAPRKRAGQIAVVVRCYPCDDDAALSAAFTPSATGFWAA